MAKIYEHTQTGYLMLGILTAGTFCATFWMIYLGFSWLGLIALLGLDASLILFSTLTIEITDGTLEMKFGPGLIHKNFDLHEVRDCFVVSPARPIDGERKMPDGWLYNLPSTRGVELRMRNGKYYRIGTDTPSELATAIRRVLQKDVMKFS